MADKDPSRRTPQDYALASPINKPVQSKLTNPSVFIPLSTNQFQPLQSYSSALQTQQKLALPSTPTKSVDERQKYTMKLNFDPIALTHISTKIEDFHQVNQLAAQYFPPKTHYVPPHPLHNQLFYEFILVDSGSILLTHVRDKKDTNRVAYSKCIITKILSSSKDWSSPEGIKPFSQPFHLAGYTFQDYRRAWWNALYIYPFTHSWFFQINKNIEKNFPIWFYDWFYCHGSIHEILPTEIKQAYKLFCDNTKFLPYQQPLQFHATFGVPWIYCWTFELEQVYPIPYPKHLVRRHQVKWWMGFNNNTCSTKIIQEYLHPSRLPEKEIPAETQTSSEPTENKVPSTTSTSEQPTSKRSKKKLSKSEISKLFQLYMEAEDSDNEVDEAASTSTSDPYGGPFAQDPYEL
jgi:hypothetical protein